MRTFITIFLIGLLAGCSSRQSTTIRNVEWADKINNTSFHNLYKVSDSVYRSEQPGIVAVPYLDSLGIKSVLNLRSHHKDQRKLNNYSLNYFNVRMRAGHINDSAIIQSLRIIQYAPKPILIHCKHGSDRTGIVIAMYRIIFQHWTKDAAIDELMNGNYGFHHMYKNIPAYIRQADIKAFRKILFNNN
jgi:tyrosine-protein phosphatase SIW14